MDTEVAREELLVGGQEVGRLVEDIRGVGCLVEDIRGVSSTLWPGMLPSSSPALMVRCTR